MFLMENQDWVFYENFIKVKNKEKNGKIKKKMVFELMENESQGSGATCFKVM